MPQTDSKSELKWTSYVLSKEERKEMIGKKVSHTRNHTVRAAKKFPMPNTQHLFIYLFSTFQGQTYNLL